MKILPTLDPKWRVLIVQRPDGIFSIAQQYWYHDEYEGRLIAEGWSAIRPFGFYATAEIAEREARANKSLKVA